MATSFDDLIPGGGAFGDLIPAAKPKATQPTEAGVYGDNAVAVFGDETAPQQVDPAIGAAYRKLFESGASADDIVRFAETNGLASTNDRDRPLFRAAVDKTLAAMAANGGQLGAGFGQVDLAPKPLPTDADFLARQQDLQTNDGIGDRVGDLFMRGGYGLAAGMDTLGAILADNAWTPSWLEGIDADAYRGERMVSATNNRESADWFGALAGTALPGEVTGDVAWNALKGGDIGTIGQYVGEQGVQSIPSMAAAMLSWPTYAMSNTGSIAQTRADALGRDPTMTDLSIAAPAGVVSALLEKAGIEKIIDPGVGNIITRPLKAAGAEGLTETGQTGAEYVGGAAETPNFDFGDMLKQMALAGVAGAGMGGVVRGAADAPGAAIRGVKGAVDAAAGPRALREAQTIAPEPAALPAPLAATTDPTAPTSAFDDLVPAVPASASVGEAEAAAPADPLPVAPAPSDGQGSGRPRGRASQGPSGSFQQPAELQPGKEGMDAVKRNDAKSPFKLGKGEDAREYGLGYEAALAGVEPEGWESGSWNMGHSAGKWTAAKAEKAVPNGQPVGEPAGEGLGEPGPAPAPVEPTPGKKFELGPLDPPQSTEPQPLGEGEKYVRTPAGNKVRTKFEVVDAATLAKAEGAMQNRDRSRETTDLQVQDIVAKFDPELLGEDPSSDRGAPIVGQDNTVYSGNGRMLALNKIFDQYPDKAAAYRAFIESQGHSTEGMERPVLVRRIAQDMTPDELRQFVVDSNKDTKLELSPSERARSDADTVTPEMLERYAGGDLNSTANKGFVEAFNKRLTAGEMGNMIGGDRRLTTAGVERIQNAVIARAYDNPKLLERIMENPVDDIRAISSSLADVAPAWAKMREAAKAGEIEARYDITGDLADAAERVSDARKRGEKPADMLAQVDAFNNMTPVTRALITAFYNPAMTRAASRKAVTEFLHDYVKEAQAQKAGTDIFGERTSGESPDAILKGLLAERDNPNGGGLALEDRAEPMEKADDGRPIQGVVERQPGARQGRSDARAEPDSDGGPDGAAERRAGGAGADGTDTGLAGASPAGDAERDQPRAGDRPDAAPDRGRDDDRLEDADPYGPVNPAPKGRYKQSFEAASFTDRQSIYTTAVEAMGWDADKFRLLAPERQIALLSRGMQQRFGIKIDVDPAMQRRFAIDQMLDAFQNVQAMAHVLGLPAEAMSLGGSLSLRLENKARYLGAFYPALGRIALPRRSNSFAHEWGHALDYFLLGLTDGDGKGLSGAVRKEGIELAEDGLPADVRSSFVALLNAMFFDKAQAAERIMQLEAKAASTKSAKVKADAEAQLKRLRDGSSQARGIRSDFYKGAQAFDGPGGDYWTSPTEMLARAFEAYTSFRVEAAGLTTEFIGKSDANYLDGAGERFEKTFPKGEERAAIFAAFDVMFERMAEAQVIARGQAAPAPTTSTQRITEHDKLVDGAKVSPLAAELNAWAERKTQREREKEGRASNPKRKRDVAADVGAAMFYSMTGDLRMMQRRTGSKALQKLIDILTKQDGKGDRTVARTFHEDVKLATNRNLNRLDNILKANKASNLNKADTRTLRDLLTGTLNPDGTPGDFAPAGTATVEAPAPNLVKAAAGIRQLLDGEFYANQEAGIDLGYTRNGYLQRTLDMPRVWHDPDGFVRQAGEVYKVVFDNEFGEAGSLVGNDEAFPRFMALARQLAKNGTYAIDVKPVVDLMRSINKIESSIEANRKKGEDTDALEGRLAKANEDLVEALGELMADVRPAFANERAKAWLAAVNLSAGDEFNAASPDSKYTKNRSLPPQADKLMEDFFIADPTESVQSYIRQSARRTAYARRFGADGAKRKALFEAMAAEGVNPVDQRTAEHILNIATGRVRSDLPQSVQEAAAALNFWTSMLLLPRAVISSLAEPFTAALVTGDTRDGWRMMGMVFGSALGSPSGKVRAELAQAIGIISSAGADHIMEARNGQTFGDETRSDRALSTMFRWTGLTPLTRAQKKAGVGIGHAFLNNLANRLKGDDARAAKDAEQLLRELGVTDPQAFADQLLELGRMPMVEELTTPFGEDYRTAQIRFNDMVIQEPNAMDRPLLALNPIGRVVYQISSFNYGYWRNIIKRNDQLLRQKRDNGEAGSWRHSGTAYGAQLIAAATLAVMVGTTISALREYLLNHERWQEREKKGTLATEMAMLGFTRTFPLGAADPFIQAYTGLKYQRDLSNMFVGPGVATLSQNTGDIVKLFQDNSRKTNTAEYRALKAGYTLASPLVAAGLTFVPGGPVTNAGKGVAIGYITSPQASTDFAKAIVGEKNLSVGEDGKKIKSGPTAYDKWLDSMFGEVERKKPGPK